MKKAVTRKPSRLDLVKYGLPSVLIPGLLLAVFLGWNPQKLFQSSNYYKNTSIFPKSGSVQSVLDGDTFTLKSGVEVRLLGVNAPERGQKGFASASAFLTALALDARVYLEYDRYQDDKYGRVLAWVWVRCESTPDFLPAEYMHLSGNQSREGLIENPKGCKEGVLVNEYMVKNAYATPVVYRDRGELKYEGRISRFLKSK